MAAWGLREVQGYTLSKYYCPAPRVRKASYHPPTYFLQLLNSSFFFFVSSVGQCGSLLTPLGPSLRKSAPSEPTEKDSGSTEKDSRAPSRTAELVETREG